MQKTFPILASYRSGWTAKVGTAHRRRAFWVVLCFAASLCSIHAAEPILTLAMAKTDSLFSKERPANRASAKVNLVRVAPTKLSPADRLSLSTVKLLEKQPGPKPANPLVLTRRSALKNKAAGRWASATVQAGFGEIFYDKPASVYGRNGTGWEEPSCGYVKLQLRF